MNPWMTEQLAEDRMRARRQSAERHRRSAPVGPESAGADPVRTGHRRAGHGRTGLVFHSVWRRLGQALIALGRRMAGDDAPGLTVEMAREAGHSPA